MLSHAEALSYFNDNKVLAYAAFKSYRMYICNYFTEEDWEQIALCIFWKSCLSYDPDRARITTWAYRIAHQHGMQEVKKYLYPKNIFSNGRMGEIEDESIDSDRPDNQIDGTELLKKFEEAQINQRNKDITKQRLEGDRLEAIGQRFNITKQRTKQIVVHTLSALKESTHRFKLVIDHPVFGQCILRNNITIECACEIMHYGKIKQRMAKLKLARENNSSVNITGLLKYPERIVPIL